MISNKDQKKDLSVFISGLPYAATEDDVRNFFADCGDITEIKLPRYQDTGRLIGYGHVTFETSEAREAALQLSKQKLGERYIEVQPAKGETPKQQTPKNTSAAPTNLIFVKNLPYEITEDEVGDFFRSCGPINNVRFVYNQTKSHFKGFGYVEFKNPESAKNALGLNGKDLKGRNIYVDLDYSAPKQGYRTKLNHEGNSKYNYDAKKIMNKKIKKDKKKDQPDVKFQKQKMERLNQKSDD